MFKYALKLVFKRKLRTFLTSLGIMIAVMLMAFILFGMSDLKSALIGEFSTRFAPTDIYVSGRDMFMFGQMNTAPKKEDASEKKEVILDDQKLEEISEIEGVISQYPMLTVSGLEIYLEEDDTPYPYQFLIGADTPSSHHIFNGFSGSDEKLDKGEIYVSDFVVSFFELTDQEILGKKITVKSSSQVGFLATASKSMIDKEYTFTIKGVTNSGNDPFFVSKDQALDILVDLGGFENQSEYIQKVGYGNVLLETQEGMTETVQKEIEENLQLYVTSTDTILSFLDTLTSGLTLALVIFGSISALVASIGIINTMIMSIYEQTKEIGIIKAMGASNTQVLVIFLIQSALIGLIGGILGLTVTYLIMEIADPYLVSILQEQGFSSLEKFFNFQVLNAIYITIGSILIGIIAGLYPARKASTINPIEALRHE